MIRIAIVGGGPGGLFTARHIEEKFKNSCRTTLFEASHRTGGKIVTGQFASAPVMYEAGVAELYNYAELGPDPLRQLVDKLGLETVPMDGRTVVLNDRILANQREVRRTCGHRTADAIREFRARCREAMPRHAWYEGNCHCDNTHPWAGRTCEEILNEVQDTLARKYLKVAAHSDLATEPHLTNGLNGLKNFLMDVPGYIRLYSVAGGIEQMTARVRERLSRTRVEVNCPVTRVQKNANETYGVTYHRNAAAGHEDFDAVFIALPHNWLGSIDWGGGEASGEPLRKAMSRFIAYYDRSGHYLRVSILFRRQFWQDRIAGSWFMLDAFGGCCVYDESSRHDTGEFGVLSWLIAGTNALSMSAFEDDRLAKIAMAALPKPLDSEALSLFVEARVHWWPAAVSAQPGGLPVKDSRSAHLPDPEGHPGLFMVGDYLFDSTINGVLESSDFATDLLSSWMLKRSLARTTSQPLNTASGSGMSRRRPERGQVRDLVRIAWRAKPPFSLLYAGSGKGLPLGGFAECGIDAWGVESEKSIHRHTPPKWRKRNLRADIQEMPFPDERFDFVCETCLAQVPEDQLPRAIRELYRVSRRGVILGSVTSEMNPDLLAREGMLNGIRSLMTLWEWGELFLAAGFKIAVVDDKTLERLWRCEKKYNKDDQDWYPDKESLRYCFYTKDPGAG